MKVLGWRSLPHSRSTLLGFVDIELTVENDYRLKICDCAVHSGPNEPWVGLPGKVQVDRRDGTVRLKSDGKVAYDKILKWGDAEARDGFSSTVIKLLLAHYPDALDSAEATA